MLTEFMIGIKAIFHGNHLFKIQQLDLFVLVKEMKKIMKMKMRKIKIVIAIE